MNEELNEVKMRMCTREVFVPHIEGFYGSGETQQGRQLLTPVRSYEQARLNGLALLAMYPMLKRFRIEKWIELDSQVGDPWVAGVSRIDTAVVDNEGKGE